MKGSATRRGLLLAAGIAACAAVQAADINARAEVALNSAARVDAPRVTYKDHGAFANGSRPLDLHPPRPGSLTAKMEAANRMAPYLGLGWGSVASARFKFFADVGVVLGGSGRTADCTWLNPGQCPVLQNQTRAEQAALDDSLRSFKAYPALNIGVTLGF